jgi:hypothetical protein
MTLTAEEAARLDFTPWSLDAMKDFGDGREVMECNRVTLLFAVGLHCKTKESLVDFIQRQPNAAKELMEGIWRAQESLEGALQILNGAEGRLIVAGSTLELSETDGRL